MLLARRRHASAAVLACLALAAPAAADTDTTGGLQAGDPPVLGPTGGLPHPASPTAHMASVKIVASASRARAKAAKSTDLAVTLPEADAVTGPGELPATGFAPLGVALLGLGFLLLGYALRPLQRQ